MNWIKRNYDQFILALVALILLALSAWLIMNALSFQDTFAGIRGQIFHNNAIPPVDTRDIKEAFSALGSPQQWVTKAGEASMFISIPYIAQGDDLIDPVTSKVMLHPPVPNAWLLKYNLDIRDPNVLNEDPDGDGFTNLDEWRGIKGDGSDGTDPNDKNSHPPYWSKLRLVQYIKQPFRLLFNAYDGEVKKPESLQFQINTVDVQQPSQFVKIGDMIQGTKFKVMGFKYKDVEDPSIGGHKDVSELIVQNTENQDNVTLVIETIVDSPDSYALFDYLWANKEFEVKKGKEFVLLPDATLRYKLIDISDTEALIQTPTGQQVKIPRLK
jgi:hypothetical protein